MAVSQAEVTTPKVVKEMFPNERQLGFVRRKHTTKSPAGGQEVREPLRMDTDRDAARYLDGNELDGSGHESDEVAIPSCKENRDAASLLTTMAGGEPYGSVRVKPSKPAILGIIDTQASQGVMAACRVYTRALLFPALVRAAAYCHNGSDPNQRTGCHWSLAAIPAALRWPSTRAELESHHGTIYVRVSQELTHGAA
ncbi:hypothetical protein HDU96_005663 [Phlyctochytrium bullatum]|nr:hypothetical protein HDU96_005663 [Phlyctochytrium bullatum]